MNVTFAVTLPALAAFAAALVLGYILIPLLHKLKFGQYIREDGPQAHKKKAGTPTMGGIIFVGAFLVGTVVFAAVYPSFWIVPVMTFGFGLIGWLDDFIKIVLKHNEGLKPDFGFFYYVLVVFALLALDNGTSFTDGLDGLATTVTLIIAVFLTVCAVNAQSELMIPSASMVGALLGFLYFNAYPAKVFMGDTGSLALGGFVGAMAFLLDMPFMILIFGFIYVLGAD